MAIDRNIRILAHRFMNRSDQTDHVIDGAIAKRSIVRIGTFCAGHVQIELQRGKSFRFLLESLTAIIIGRRWNSVAGVAIVVSGGVALSFLLPRCWTGTHHLLQTLQRFASMAIGIDADFISKLASQQPIDGYVEPLAEHIPKGSLDAADRVVDNASDRTGARGG